MLLSLVLLLISVLISEATAAEFRTHYCGLNTTSYTTNTTYYSNLIQVIDSLASDTTVNDSKFLTNNSGNIHPDIAYGLYLCRADVLPNDCRNCLLKAREDINKTCPFSKEAVFWNDDCMLRYANHSMVLVMDSATFVPECNKVNISEHNSEKTRFWEVARKLLGELATQASIDPKKRFAFQELSYMPKETVYGYVECTPDLSGSDCERCLRVSIDRLPQYCSGREGARVLTPSCNVRYEIYKFLQFPATSSESPEAEELRPSMASVLLMLNGSSVALPLPQNPPLVSHSRVRYTTPEVLESDDSICKSTLWPTDASLEIRLEERCYGGAQPETTAEVADGYETSITLLKEKEEQTD